jgi:hypothetical protein
VLTRRTATLQTNTSMGTESKCTCFSFLAGSNDSAWPDRRGMSRTELRTALSGCERKAWVVSTLRPSLTRWRSSSQLAHLHSLFDRGTVYVLTILTV